MATLYVAEFSTIGGRSNFPVAGAQCPPLAEQTISMSGTSAQASNGFGTNTKFIRINTDAICSIAFGANPTAATTDMRLAANQTEYFAVIPGQKIAAITNS